MMNTTPCNNTVNATQDNVFFPDLPNSVGARKDASSTAIDTLAEVSCQVMRNLDTKKSAQQSSNDDDYSVPCSSIKTEKSEVDLRQEEKKKEEVNEEASSQSSIPCSSQSPQKLSPLERAQSKWDIKFEKLKAYKTNFGHCNVPREYAKDRSFGTWVATQRVMYKKYTESEENKVIATRIQRLDSIGFEWNRQKRNVDSVIKPWEERFEDLKAFKRRFWHCDVPRDWNEDPSLALWVRNQRGNYKKYLKGIKTNLSEERVKQLKDIDFTWSIKKAPVHKSWDQRFEELQSYKKDHGNCNVPRRWRVDETLGRWVRQQRYEYDALRAGKRSTLNEQRIHRLEELGFSWRLKGQQKAALPST